MYITHPIFGFICLVAVESVLFIITLKLIAVIVEFFVNTVIGKWTFQLIMSERMIRIHEAGHMVAYLRTLDNCKTSKYRHKAAKIKDMHQHKCGGMVTIETNEWNERRKLLLLGGIAATLKIKNKQLSRLGYTFHYYLGGCQSDFKKLRTYYNMSKKTIIWMVNSMIYSFSEKDMDFIRHIADMLGQKETSKNKYNVFAKSFEKDELFKLAEEYRTDYRKEI